MLSEMGLRHGSRVMEIGTGSGYNAALIAELVGEPALVTTVDIDPTLTAEAIPRLDRLGYGRITVSCGDGADGVPERAPFDRVVATVGCVDISPAWVDQLADGGRLLAPLEHGPMHPRVAVRRSEHRPGGQVHGTVRIRAHPRITGLAPGVGRLRACRASTIESSGSRPAWPRPSTPRVPGHHAECQDCGTSPPTWAYATGGRCRGLAWATTARWP